jgi:hypothetical protein
MTTDAVIYFVYVDLKSIDSANLCCGFAGSIFLICTAEIEPITK